MSQKLLHLSFSLQQHKGAFYCNYEGNGLSVSWHISAFLLYSLRPFLFCIFIWKNNATTLKLHQKIAQKCYYCKTIIVTFVFKACCSNFQTLLSLYRVSDDFLEEPPALLTLLGKWNLTLNTFCSFIPAQQKDVFSSKLG